MDNTGRKNAALDKPLQVTMKYEVTVHGFRSTFRDWAGEETNYPNELCEMALALAHTIMLIDEVLWWNADGI